MKIIQPYHTGFVVSDMERSVDFYTNVLGMRVERQPAEVSSSWLADVVGYDSVSIVLGMVGVGSGSSIELLQYKKPAGGRREHLDDRSRVGSAHCGMLVDERARMVRTPEGERRQGHRSADPAGCRVPVGPVRVVLPGPGRQLARVRRACPQAGGLDRVLAGPVHTRIYVFLPPRRSFRSGVERCTAIPSTHTPPNGRPQGIAPTRRPLGWGAVTAVSVVSAQPIPLIRQPGVGASLVGAHGVGSRVSSCR